MTQDQRKILRPLASVIIRGAKHEWWELKRQIFEFGYQSGYPAESLFTANVKRAVQSLSNKDRALVTPHKPDANFRDLNEKIARMLHGIILERARVASARMENW